jgi:replication factor C subunit 2/4
MKEIWLEKYRPKVLSDVYGNVDQINTLRNCVSKGTIPNLILTGPPGVGKTSSVFCIVRELLGDKCS